jgi:hypothetical protein
LGIRDTRRKSLRSKKSATHLEVSGGVLPDDRKVNSRLTLNIGLRWDYEASATERFNRQNRGFDFTSKSPITVQGYDLCGGIA